MSAKRFQRTLSRQCPACKITGIGDVYLYPNYPHRDGWSCRHCRAVDWIARGGDGEKADDAKTTSAAKKLAVIFSYFQGLSKSEQSWVVEKLLTKIEETNNA